MHSIKEEREHKSKQDRRKNGLQIVKSKTTTQASGKRRQEDRKEQDSDDDVQKECPICFTFMVNPCRLDCGHRFCIKCIKLMEKPVIDKDGHKCTRKKQCPMCRRELRVQKYSDGMNVID